MWGTLVGTVIDQEYLGNGKNLMGDVGKLLKFPRAGKKKVSK